jgi:hypothetical protein
MDATIVLMLQIDETDVPAQLDAVNCLWLLGGLVALILVYGWFSRGGIGYKVRRSTQYPMRPPTGPVRDGSIGEKTENALETRAQDRRERANAQLRAALERLEDEEDRRHNDKPV